MTRRSIEFSELSERDAKAVRLLTEQMISQIEMIMRPDVPNPQSVLATFILTMGSALMARGMTPQQLQDACDIAVARARENHAKGKTYDS